MGGKILRFTVKRPDTYLLLTMLFVIILSCLLIFIRLQIASVNGDLPNYVFSGDTMRAFKEPSFYSDELFYYNFTPSKNGFLQEFLQRVSLFLSEGIPVNINLYGYYVHFIKKIFVNTDRSWFMIIFLTGFPAYILFVFLVHYIFRSILKISPRKVFLLTLFLVLSPVALVHGVSWLRDMIIYDLMLLAVIFAYKRKLTGFLIVTVLQVFLRGYMIVPHLLIMLYMWPRFVARRNVAILGSIFMIFLALFVVAKASGLTRLFNEFPQRFIEATTGLSLWLVTGRIVPRMSIYGILHDFNVFGVYYTVFLYAVMYFKIFLDKLRGKRFSVVEKRFWALFLSVTIVLTILHSAAFGFLVPRIIFIFQILAWIAFGSSMSPLGKCNAKCNIRRGVVLCSEKR